MTDDPIREIERDDELKRRLGEDLDRLLERKRKNALGTAESVLAILKEMEHKQQGRV